MGNKKCIECGSEKIDTREDSSGLLCTSCETDFRVDNDNPKINRCMSCKLLQQIDRYVYQCLDGRNDPYDDNYCSNYERKYK